MIIELHQSWLEEYMLCPERARQNWFKLVPDGPTDATAIGTALHAAAEHVLTGGDYDSALFTGKAALCVEVEHPHFQWVQVKKLDTAFRHFEQAWDNWYDQVYPRLGSPLLVEQQFNIHLATFPHPDRISPPIDVFLAGTIDFGDDAGGWDWKTGKNGLTKYEGGRFGEGWKLKRWNLQAKIYCWAMRQLELLPNPNLFTFAAVAKDAWQVRFLDVECSDADDAWLRQLAQNVVTMLTADLPEWPKNDHHALCSPLWCPAWTSCKGAVNESTTTSAAVATGSPHV